MSFNRKIEAYVPLMPPRTKYTKERFKECIIEIVNLSGQIPVRHKNKDLAFLEIEAIDLENEKLISLFEGKDNLDNFILVLKFTTSWELQEKSHQDPFWSFGYYVTKTIQHLIICLNLVKPAVFDSRDGILIKTDTLPEKTDVEKEKIPMLCSCLDLALDLGDTYKWPPIREFEVSFVKDILENNWSAFEGVSGNRLQRAINAFSYIFHDNLHDNSYIDLFYSLIGIEALFVDGKDNVQRQVDAKSQLLLGERSIFKKKFNELYDFRSRYIHGQLNFTSKYYVGEENSQLHKEKNFDNSCLGVLILLSSIQKHLEFGKSEIEFEYRIKEDA
ncbi:MAG TPA: hypothetical protein VNS32_22740 [Flavisolibacter sp.]|nr:hypothetical protein [Flavisolibacter sp.]